MAVETERLVAVSAVTDAHTIVALVLAQMEWAIQDGTQDALDHTIVILAQELTTQVTALELMAQDAQGLLLALVLMIQLTAEMKQGALGQLLLT